MARRTGKEKASDVPSWAAGRKPEPSESGRDFADRLMRERYGAGRFATGPGSEHSRLRKFGDRLR